jgi:hypothetical protein
VSTKTLGNPSHCDLTFINPTNEEIGVLKTAIRSFNSKLIANCEILLDDEIELEQYVGLNFKKSYK